MHEIRRSAEQRSELGNDYGADPEGERDDRREQQTKRERYRNGSRHYSREGPHGAREFSTLVLTASSSPRDRRAVERYFFFRRGPPDGCPDVFPDFGVLPPRPALPGNVSHDDDPLTVRFDATSPIESAPSADSRES